MRGYYEKSKDLIHIFQFFNIKQFYEMVQICFEFICWYSVKLLEQ